MVKSKKVKTLNKSSKLNVIFDIDDTLIHSRLQQNDKRLFMGVAHNTEYKLFKMSHNKTCIYFIRNYVHMLLQYCFEYCNVGIWSLGTKSYIIPLLKMLLTKQQYDKLTIIISRKNRTDKYVEYIDEKNGKKFKINILNGEPTKPLQYLFDNYGGFTPKNTLLIDDSAFNISINPLNSMYIPKYCLSDNDTYLLNVYQWLNKNKNKKDIRKIDKKLFEYDEKVTSDCLLVNKYDYTNKKLEFGDFVEYKKGGLIIVGYITNITKDKYDIVEFDDGDLYKNNYKFTTYKGLDKSSLQNVII